MNHDEVVTFFVSLAVLLAAARLLGEIARTLNQPAVLGELLAGILLGPTVLGHFSPETMAFLFPSTGNVPIALKGLTTLSIALFLLVAGMEVDLSTIWRQGRSAMFVSMGGIVIPFALGFAVALALPMVIEGRTLGREDGADPLLFALFFATALSISALPVIAKTLMDLGLYRSDLGMVVIASAVFDDLTGWIIFAVILAMMGQSHHFEIWQTIALTLSFAAFMLTIGRWIIHRTLPFVQARFSWPGGVLGFALTLALLGAAFTEWIGVHAIFGAFLVGVALGDSQHLRERTRATIEQFVSFIFAPLFFASVGLHVNFYERFELTLVLIVLGIACVGKLVGCALAARLAGMAPRQSWALGSAMNARGAMEIILGLLALQAGLIRERMFVALVVMALVTSMMAGPLMQRILRRKKPKRFTAFVGAGSFIGDLRAADRFKAILELVPVSGAKGVDLAKVADAVIERERVIPTGLGNGIALPHARIKGLAAPQVAMGLSRQGIDFDSPDGEPAHIICVILTPEEDENTALELYRDILNTFKDKSFRDRTLRVSSYTELLALLASATGPSPGEATVAHA